jgi:hypothetical protein
MFKTMVVRLPEAMAARIDAKAKAEGMTRQQLLASLVDLGLDRAAVSASAPGLLTASVALKALNDCDGENSWNTGTRLKSLLWKHLSAMLSR